MRLKYIIVTSMLALTSGFAQSEQHDADFYAQRGKQAGHAYPGLATICDISTPLKRAGQRPPQDQPSAAARTKRTSRPEAAPMRVFDNLYYVGTAGVASWALQTSEGLILIDALNNDAEAERYIDGGLRKLGLDPADIRYLVITHAHGDHYGGQNYLVKRYHPRVIMSDQDWKELEKPQLEFSNPSWGQPPKRDLSVNDGEQLTLGDTNVSLYVTPGHTPGTLSLLFPVRDQEQAHMAALWGGTGLNFGPDRARILAYSASAERFRMLVAQHGADVFLSNHPARDGAGERMARLAQRTPGQANPFVGPAADVQGAFELLRDCSHAQALLIPASAAGTP
ncbi:MBL fold metallo-hydrolase [Xanthomonas arboricola]